MRCCLEEVINVFPQPWHFNVFACLSLDAVHAAALAEVMKDTSEIFLSPFSSLNTEYNQTVDNYMERSFIYLYSLVLVLRLALRLD